MEIYSYVFSAQRSHSFDTTADALDTVRQWHAAEMTETAEREDDGCTWQTIGSYHTPPEYCDNDTDPGQEYCAAHVARAQALEEQ